jgi:hypothetical protein
MQFPDSALAKVKIELECIADSDATGLYLSIIETGAIRALQQGQQYNTQRHEEILVELNRLVRKFERSLVAEEKIREELSSLSDDAQTFVRVELDRGSCVLPGRDVGLSANFRENPRSRWRKQRDTVRAPVARQPVPPQPERDHPQSPRDFSPSIFPQIEAQNPAPVIGRVWQGNVPVIF